LSDRVKAILDASPIIAFFAEMCEPKILLLLRRLGYELLVPTAVSQHDIVREPSMTILAKSVVSGSISLLPPVAPEMLAAFMNSHPSLGEGESEVILDSTTLNSNLSRRQRSLDTLIQAAESRMSIGTFQGNSTWNATR